MPEIVQTATSVDGTERYLMRMADGETVETVWMPDGDGGERGDGSEAADEEAGERVGAEEAVRGGVTGDRAGDRCRREQPRQRTGLLGPPRRWTPQEQLRRFGGGRLPAGNDLRVQPGRVCGELPVLPDGQVGYSPQSHGRGDCRAGGGGSESTCDPNR